MILLGGDLVDPVDLRLRLDLVTTTSPSALMYGSIDGWRRHLALNGSQLLDGALERAARLRRRLSNVAGLAVIDESIRDTPGVAEWDPLKLCVDVSQLGITGWQAMDWLESQRRLLAQLGNTRWVVCSLTYADDDEAMDRLGEAFEDLAADPPAPDRPAPDVPPLSELNVEQVMSPHEAFFAETEQVTHPIGRVCAEMISPYPPGVPVVLPGERFTEPVLRYLRSAKAAGMVSPDASDPNVQTFRVVR
jgi:arginine/lysine/ornithine decarboxylase